MRKIILFLATFLIALVIQSVIWQNFDYLDEKIWADEARYIYTGDKEAFNPLVGYGHPGGPPLIITIFANVAFGVSYEDGMAGSVALLNALMIAGCTLVAYMLRPNSIWWIITAGTLMLNRLYPGATPPSGIIAPLIALLFLLGLWLYEQASRVTWPAIIMFGGLIGLGVATRSDITPAMAAPLMLLLLPRIGWKRTAVAAGTAAIVFTATNPFMWIMSPWQHLYDLFYEIHYHYANYKETHLPLLSVFLISPLSLISIGLAMAAIMMRRKMRPAVATPYLILMLVLTVALTIILMTARSQAQRYYFPLAFLWETFLPLFILHLLPRVKFSFLVTSAEHARARRLIAVALAAFLIVSQAVLIIHLYFLPQVIFVCQPQPNRWLFCEAKTKNL